MKCFYCGGEVMYTNEDMLSDLMGIDLPEEEDSIVGFFTCSKCGASYEVYQSNEKEVW